MKIQIDTENKTITLLENVEAGEFATFLSTHGLYDWTIIANYAIKVPTEDKSLWKELRDLPTREFKDFTNPLPNPFVNPILPYTPLSPTYPHGTGDPILWCGEGTTKTGHDIDIDTVKRSGDIFCYTTDTARMEQGEYLSEYLKNNKDANTI